MPVSTALAATARPDHYIQQLVAQAGAGATARLGRDGRATITLGQGACVLTPSGDGLALIIMAPDLGALAGVRDDVSGHLLRLAAGEDLRVDWTPPMAGDALPIIDPVASDYLVTHCTPPDDLLQDLVSRTREVAGEASGMQVSPDEGAFLTMLVRLTGARHAVEVGVFTGYSSICIARGLPPGGHLLACDVSDEWTAVARDYWQRAGVADRIELRIGPAIETLRALPAEPAVDIAFIDADKESYPAYYEELVPRLRPGGLVVLDNVFLGGRVLDPACRQERPLAMRRLNDFIAQDDRVDSVMLSVRDGVTLARKR